MEGWNEEGSPFFPANSSPNSHLSICNAATRVHADESVGFNVNIGRPTIPCFLGTWAVKIKGEP